MLLAFSLVAGLVADAIDIVGSIAEMGDVAVAFGEPCGNLRGDE